MSRWFLGGVLVVSRWCLGGDTIKTTPSTQHHHQHTIYTTSSTLHHLHYIIKKNIINTTPSRQHHQHNTINIIINTTQHYQHRGPGKSARLNTVDARCVCVAGAALRALLAGLLLFFCWILAGLAGYCWSLARVSLASRRSLAALSVVSCKHLVVFCCGVLLSLT